MKQIYLQMAAGLAATLTIGTSAACAQQQDETGDPVQLIVEAEDDDNSTWNDEPQTSGTWTYDRENSESFAMFGARDEAPLAIIRCDLTTREVGIGRFGASGEASERIMRIRTETQQSLFTATPKGNVAGLFGIEIDASNRLLDAMAITKGRFAIEVEWMEPLYIPAWAEVTRVIEDCR